MRSAYLLLTLFLAAPAQATPIAPTGKWVVEFNDAQCVASREYGSERLFLKSSPFGDVVQVGFMIPGGYATTRQVEASITPASGTAYLGTAVNWSPPKMKGAEDSSRLFMANLPSAEFNRLSLSPTLKITFGDMQRELTVSGMDQLAKVMKTCVDDLQTFWPNEKDGGTPAKANLASYFTDGDYPADAVRNEQSGVTGFALLVDESGRVADCMVTQTSGQAGLDTQSCAILKIRARFTPARGPDGKPRKARASGRIRWMLP